MSSSIVGPEVLYSIYCAAFPFISYYLFNVAHKNHHKEWTTTLLCLSLLISVLYSWMYVLGPKVYIFVYPVLCIAGIVPLLKIMALELNCLSPEMQAHVRGSFKNYYLYLSSPSEVAFDPKVDVAAKTASRLKHGAVHLLSFIIFNQIVIYFHVSNYPVMVRGFATAVQLALCFCTVADLSLGFMGLITQDVYMEDLFDHPYLAVSPAEFWGKRWNLVVHKYIHKMLYVPLGGRDRKTMLLPLIYISVGLLHEIPMSFLPSAKFGYWTLIFVLHMTAMFGQMALEQVYPNWKENTKARIAMRIFTWFLCAYTADLAFRGFGMTAEMMAQDSNSLMLYPIQKILHAN